MRWVRASEFAEQLRVCKKTAVRKARRAGYAMEKRPVRGGWAWFIYAPEHEVSVQAQVRIDPRRLEQCIGLALRLDGNANNAARLAVRLYEVL